MAYWIASSPHNHKQNATSKLMRLVTLALIPGIVAQWYFFGWGNLVQIGLCIVTAMLAEVTVLSLRERNAFTQVADGSAMLTGALIGVSIPALAPWWIAVLGSLFAIVIVKQLYGGLGHNMFNPAMAAYVMLLISFPVQMTTWLPAESIAPISLDFTNTLVTIFKGYTQEGYSVAQLKTSIDGVTMATPLDTLKTQISLGYTVEESFQSPVFGEYFGLGWEWVNAGFLLGGLFLIAKKAIHWTIPLSFLFSLFACSFIGYAISPDTSASTLFHWLNGATMLGAFFILTDPVSAATSNKGRLIYGALAGLLVYIIRNFGGYPDALAFAVLLVNMTAPFIDQHVRPRTYGHDIEAKR